MNRIDLLDVLRALAALSVFFYHIAVIGGDPFEGFFNLGGIGVDLFFVLSGFFIGLSVLAMPEWNLRIFLTKRFLRLAPGYYISLLLVIAFAAPTYIISVHGLIDILAHVSFIHVYSYHTHGSINGVYWSLGVEAAFYILIAISALKIRNDRHIALILSCWIITAWIWRFLVSQEDSLIPILKFIWSTQIIGMLDEFAYGIIIARFYRSSSLMSKLLSYKVVFLLLFVSLSILYFYLAVQKEPDYWSNWVYLVIGRTFLAISFSILIFVAILISSRIKDNGKLIINKSGMPFLGRISFGIYLYHMPIILALKNSEAYSDENKFLFGIVCLGMTILMAVFSFYFIEKRFYRF
ncbi:acyltransferase [Endozoicomonas sp. SM1973]|uniref:Acyltransferase n=1 Tax=Spartinivicinus marinus TaxID=2994442 RepID=A0A853IDQ2_9GAMM|nr:acyltransferase [Spartinivicinus marinus]MCX4028851.1 acyltransferase [Spartinivicinus marinus]NYZ65566.1 acyltransferase [Spartinivicinus marinus]